MTINKANKLFNNIGTNALNNEITSVGIIEYYTTLNLENKFRVGTYSIYTALGVKNNAGIMSELRGQNELSKLHEKRKIVVDKLILPMADLKELVVSDEKKTNLQKKKTKAENKANVEIDNIANKSDEKIRQNAIRTTANDIVYPTLFLCSLDKSNYKFKNNRVMINVMILPIFKTKISGTDEEPAIKEIDVCKSVFGFDKSKVGVEQGQKFFVECNFSVLKKLAQKMLFNVKVMQSLEDEKQTNDLEESTEEITKSEYTEDKAEQMVSSIKSQLTYLDNNKYLDGILQIENHIRELNNYGDKLELIAEALRKQSKNSINKDIYGSWVVDNATSTVLEGNTIKAIEDNFRKKFKVA
tara:strand:+ start:869 stop:1936 length:1068 start_codon:yes stop_codon:yes gene_type:complete